MQIKSEKLSQIGWLWEDVTVKYNVTPGLNPETEKGPWKKGGNSNSQ
jgi:hypothetical protein